MARRVLVALVIGLALGACGDADDDSSSDGPVATVGDGGQESGEGGQESGDGGQESGEGGQESGEGGQESGEGGQESGEGGQESGDGGGGGAEIAPDDLASQILMATTGLLPSDLGITGDDLACMNAELRAALPDGLPENIPASPDTLQALNDASLACRVDFSG